jgi:uncharacterized protein YcbK (DUF882 family)
MTSYRIDRVERGAHGQSWDILGEGDTIGPEHHTHASWDQLWRWPNFKPEELASESDGVLMLYAPAIDALQEVRSHLGQPLTINSAYRSPAHNHKIGGAKRSRHLAGAAFDVACPEGFQAPLANVARRFGFNGIIFYHTFVHLDFRARRYERTRR